MTWLEGAGWLVCMLGFGWHVRRFAPPRLVKVVEVREVKVAAPLRFDLNLERPYEGTVTVSGRIEHSEDVEGDTVLAAIDKMRADAAAMFAERRRLPTC